MAHLADIAWRQRRTLDISHGTDLARPGLTLLPRHRLFVVLSELRNNPPISPKICARDGGEWGSVKCVADNVKFVKSQQERAGPCGHINNDVIVGTRVRV
jgi:hypothetical protein